MPASLATVETATVGGVVDEPMMMSALDSVTKRRALVVAAVGSPPSSSTMTFSGTPPISFGTKSSALRSGMPSAAAGPVVVTVDADGDFVGLRERGRTRQSERRGNRCGGQKSLLHSFLP